ncbi:uncharacterized protein LOC134709668 [Mytilus trossulus]|uniref:uncharacterized protein LOC134709668 n=1 Tax=Mytilus trossulus TaxID=6551 RepID=UPI003005CA2F
MRRRSITDSLNVKINIPADDLKPEPLHEDEFFETHRDSADQLNKLVEDDSTPDHSPTGSDLLLTKGTEKIDRESVHSNKKWIIKYVILPSMICVILLILFVYVLYTIKTDSHVHEGHNQSKNNMTQSEDMNTV